MTESLSVRIRAMAHQQGAIILAHYYQPPEIQAVADYVGDSLQLAREARQAEAEVIVSCGVSFMAETAKILNPGKLVVNPAPEAGCPMADMVDAAGLKALRAQHPGAVVVSYVNTTAEVKAESDICCTSSNALQVINSIPQDTPIIFAPDRNLGANVAAWSGRSLILWDGCCPIHDRLTPEHIKAMQERYPEALVAVHPECRPEVVALADKTTSTAGILKYIDEMEAEFIIGTEQGLLNTAAVHSPHRRCYPAREDFICPDMKKITPQRLLLSLERLQPTVEIDEAVRQRAYQALDCMLQLP
ncbi:MAG: quinolinate synthase NadA [Syntrophomonadaceae bacterium]|nr:quinolinate synthase NadA [Syntrophomonadaceae bacterium]